MFQGITLTPEKLEMLSQNFDPKPLFSVLGQGGGIMQPGGAGTYPNAYSSFMAPGGTAKPAPQLTPQMLSAFMPKPPQLLPPAGLAGQRQVQAPAQFTAPLQPQDSYSKILYGR